MISRGLKGALKNEGILVHKFFIPLRLILLVVDKLNLIGYQVKEEKRKPEFVVIAKDTEPSMAKYSPPPPYQFFVALFKDLIGKVIRMYLAPQYYSFPPISLGVLYL